MCMEGAARSQVQAQLQHPDDSGEDDRPQHETRKHNSQHNVAFPPLHLTLAFATHGNQYSTAIAARWSEVLLCTAIRFFS